MRKRSDTGEGAGRIRLIKDLEEGLPEIMTDATQVQQILLNLMLNAVDAMYQGGTLKIQSSRAAEGSYLRVDVSDTGTGIDPALGEKIFQPFFSTKIKGTGLGLATVRRLVDINKGEVYFKSEVGAGSTFTVLFPLDPEGGASET